MEKDPKTEKFEGLRGRKKRKQRLAIWKLIKGRRKIQEKRDERETEPKWVREFRFSFRTEVYNIKSYEQ